MMPSKINDMKNTYTLIILLLGCGCQMLEPSYNQNQANQQCPSQPLTKLTVNNVKEIELTEKTTTESGIINSMTTLAYAFQAEDGQKLTYKTQQDLCIWIYTPDNQLLNTTTLLKKGKYLMQIASRQGSQNFDINLSLSYPKKINSEPEEPLQADQILPQNNTSPEQFIRNYYSNINNRNYSEAYNDLSSEFKGFSGNYKSYQEWWNKVAEVEILRVEILQQTDQSAFLKVELQYLMKDQRLISDKKPFFYLIWDNSNSKWLLNGKAKS